MSMLSTQDRKSPISPISPMVHCVMMRVST